jgi:hypothetical protein
MRGHYTFRALISLEADSEKEAKAELQRRLGRLHEAEYISGFGIEHVADDITYDPHSGLLRVPVK